MSIITELNILRRACLAKGVPGPHTYAIPTGDVPAAAAEITVMINGRKPKSEQVTIEEVTRAIFHRCLTILDCKVIVAEMVGP